MVGKWQENSLGDLIDVKHGFAFQGGFIHDEPRGDVLLTPGNFAIGGGFKGDRFKYFDGPVPDAFVLAEGDLLVTMTDLSKQSDTLGLPAFVPSHSDGRRYLHNQRLGKVLIKDSRAIDPTFLHYLMCSAEYRHEVLASATGTTVKHTSPERIRRFKFLRPPLTEQRAIAHILGTLDDKIELNRQMSETLEAMARALFKSWFVDFDPVRAKAQGCDTGLPQSVANLFPDSFEYSELGGIPSGWQVALAGSLFDVAIGKTPPRKEHHWFSTDLQDIPWMSIKDLGQAGAFIAEVSEYLTSTAVERFRVRRIPDGTVVLSFKLTVGRVAITDGEMLSNEAIAHFLPREETFLSPAYLYCYLRQFDYERLGSTSSIATAVNSHSVRSIPVLVPARAIHLAFDREVVPLFCRMKSAQRESRALVALRDALLPKLISGELRVKDAEKVIGRVA